MKMLSKEKAWKLVIIMAAALIMASVTVVIFTTRSNANYENEVPIFIEFCEGEVEPTEEPIYENIGYANEETQEIIDSCKEKMIEYFKAKNIDVSYRLDELEKTYVYDIALEEDFIADVWGYYLRGTKDIYLNRSILEDQEMLEFTYIHEVLHYLGCIDSETTMMTEGMADAITEDILGYVYEGSYDIPRVMGHMLLIADPDVIEYIIEGNDLDDRIDGRLREVPRKWEVPKNDLEMSQMLDILLFNLEYYELEAEVGVSYYMQACAIVYAYCNTFKLNGQQLDMINDISAIVIDEY